MPADTPNLPSGGALILAAGYGRRFGSDKRQHQLADGRTLLRATLDCYAAAYSEICLVIRPEDDSLATLADDIPIPVRIAISEQAELGMGHSLAAGIQSIDDHWGWASVALADMPFIKTKTLEELLRVFAQSPTGSIVVPCFNETPGHPVTFPSSCFGEMLVLTGDRGARPVLAAHADEVIRYAVSDPGVLQDVDVPAGVPL